MRFADGGFKPGYNIQIAATGTGVVLSVMATDRRNDAGLAVPMVDDLERRYGRVQAAARRYQLCHRGRHHCPCQPGAGSG